MKNIENMQQLINFIENHNHQAIEQAITNLPANDLINIVKHDKHILHMLMEHSCYDNAHQYISKLSAEQLKKIYANEPKKLLHVAREHNLPEYSFKLLENKLSDEASSKLGMVWDHIKNTAQSYMANPARYLWSILKPETIGKTVVMSLATQQYLSSSSLSQHVQKSIKPTDGNSPRVTLGTPEGLLSCSRQSLQNISWQADFTSREKVLENWDVEQWPSRSFNEEEQRYTKDPDNLYTSRQGLHIRGKRDPQTQELTSARMTTQHHQYFTYGSLTVRAKLPMQQGTWPAIWLLGDKIHSHGWPACGELDIMEHVNEEGSIKGSAHDENHCWKSQVKNKEFDVVVDDPTLAHNYTLTWSPDQVTWSLNGNPYGTLYKHDYTKTASDWWAYDDPQFLILNLALGGLWPKSPLPSFEEAEMVVESAEYSPLDLSAYRSCVRGS
tara:strand:+ start:482 stop:1804 length:1323 start_codon:yes stop_codon:yes gene_type:complete